MTDESPGATEATEAQGGRGRPRPQATIDRDAQVLAHIQAAGPQTRKQISAALPDIKGSEIYLSLYRLSRATPAAVVKEGTAWKVPDATVAVG